MLTTSNPKVVNACLVLTFQISSVPDFKFSVNTFCHQDDDDDDGGYFFLHKHITSNILSITNIHCVYQYECVDPAFRYRCAIFCTQVLFLIKRKHHSRLTSTAKAQRKQINELKTHILSGFRFVLIFIWTKCFDCVRLEGSQQMFVVEFNLLTFSQKYFTFVDVSFPSP